MQARSLHELRVSLPSRFAEAVAASLIEQGAGGVEITSRDGRAILRVYGEGRPALDAQAKAARLLLRQRGIPNEISVCFAEVNADWETSFMRDLEPVRISRSLTLLPTTAAESPTAGRIVRLGPAPAFGFGEHATTRLAARAVDRACRVGARSVLDVGTGSGVLALVAASSGATRVVGIDFDSRAVAAARANATLNSATACTFSATPIARLRARFEVVVANVDLNTLLALAVPVARAVAPGGSLFLAGFLREHATELEARYVALGLTKSSRKVEAGWALVHLRRSV